MMMIKVIFIDVKVTKTKNVLNINNNNQKINQTYSAFNINYYNKKTESLE